MTNIILFDQDTQHYRQSIYLYFRNNFEEIGYNLIVVYDNGLNNIKNDTDFFIGINYTFNSFNKIIKKYDCKLIIQFVWLRYKFIIPLMIYNRARGVKTIVWSHGINLQNKNQPLKNQLYYLRQRLADGLIIYTPEQKKYIKTDKNKVFVANNTLNFESLSNITISKEELKKKYKLENEKVILCVGRMNTNNRKVKHLVELAKLINNNYKIIIIGPGVYDKDKRKIETLNNVDYLGPIYNQRILCEYYKLADIFIMPGAIGLSINQSFYYGTPVVLENVEQGPEAFYLKDGINGFYYEKGNIDDLNNKIKYLLNNKSVYKIFSEKAKKTIEKEASIKNMLKGFIDAIKYVEK